MYPIESDRPVSAADGAAALKGETAWNGLVLRHPATWEVARLDSDQIQWREDQRATLEVRWALHRGRWDDVRALRRFRRGAKRKGLPRPEPWSVPQSWLSGLSPFRVTGFSWRRPDADAGGRGLLAYCPQCRRQNLVLIHPHLTTQSDLIPQLLATFRDHPHGEAVPLSLFGIRARLPAGAKMGQFRFETGRYRLLWRKGRLRIGLHRWAPAGVLLEGQSLPAFVSGQFRVPEAGLVSLDQGGHMAVGIIGRGSSVLKPSAILRPWLARRVLRVWHLPDANSLLGVEINGRGRGLTSMFARLCDSYESF